MNLSDANLTDIADEVFQALTVPTEVVPFSERYPSFTLDDAYRVVGEIRRRRELRGERVVGRKIGFTNAAAWTGYGITAPIWNYLYDSTTFDLTPGFSFPVGRRPHVRMETEIAFGLKKTPHVGMREDELLDCIGWVGHDFEVCTSIFPHWKFRVADAAATGVHAALLLGGRYEIDEPAAWLPKFRTFTSKLSNASGASFAGGGAQVLGSPIHAFARLLQELERYGDEPLQIGDIITTGTLTHAPPAGPGEIWRARVEGLPFEDIETCLV